LTCPPSRQRSKSACSLSVLERNGLRISIANRFFAFWRNRRCYWPNWGRFPRFVLTSSYGATSMSSQQGDCWRKEEEGDPPPPRWVVPALRATQAGPTPALRSDIRVDGILARCLLDLERDHHPPPTLLAFLGLAALVVFGSRFTVSECILPTNSSRELWTRRATVVQSRHNLIPTRDRWCHRA